VSLLLSFDVHNECRAAIKLLKFWFIGSTAAALISDNGWKTLKCLCRCMLRSQRRSRKNRWRGRNWCALRLHRRHEPSAKQRSYRGRCAGERHPFVGLITVCARWLVQPSLNSHIWSHLGAVMMTNVEFIFICCARRRKVCSSQSWRFMIALLCDYTLCNIYYATWLENKILICLLCGAGRYYKFLKSDAIITTYLWTPIVS
jgi:hypothetical protein